MAKRFESDGQKSSSSGRAAEARLQELDEEFAELFERLGKARRRLDDTEVLDDLQCSHMLEPAGIDDELDRLIARARAVAVPLDRFIKAIRRERTIPEPAFTPIEKAIGELRGHLRQIAGEIQYLKQT